MGYITEHRLKVDTQRDIDLIEVLREYSDGARFALTENGETCEPCKWYGHEEDLKHISKENPDALFSLYGNGEEFDDIWVEYFKNGKMQKARAIITYEPFDERLLK